MSAAASILFLGSSSQCFQNTMRPYRFKLNRNHSLSQGLVFAGLGNVVRGKMNDSAGGLPGVYEAAPPPTAFGLRRRGFDFSRRNYPAVVPYQGQFDNQSGIGPYWSISAWIRTSDENAPSSQYVIGQYYTQANQRKWAFRRKSGVGNYDLIASQNGSSAATVLDMLSGFADNELHHFAVVRPNTGTNDFRFYLDGEYVAETTNQPMVMNPTMPSRLTVGGLDGGNFFPDEIFDACYYTRELTVGEIKTLANPHDPMLGGFIQPIAAKPKPFFVTAPTAPNICTIFDSPIIGV